MSESELKGTPTDWAAKPDAVDEPNADILVWRGERATTVVARVDGELHYANSGVHYWSALEGDGLEGFLVIEGAPDVVTLAQAHDTVEGVFEEVQDDE